MDGYAELADPPSASFADDSAAAAESASARGAVTSSSRRRWGFRSFFSTANEDASLDSIDDEDDGSEMLQTNGLSDRNTIVDMSLRMGRFGLLVAIALVSAFLFAYLTNSSVKLATVAASDEQKVTDTVELYNTIFGFVLFAGGKVFEVYCETLIFPTLTTYLHNCSLYPGDQPARVHSPIKVRAIFWGLKTVIILMNVAFASVFVGQRTVNSMSARRLSADEFRDALQVSSPLLDFQDGILRGELPVLPEDSAIRSALLGLSSSEDVACDDRWIDPPTVSLGFRVHDWSDDLYLRSELVVATEIPRIGEFLFSHNASEDAFEAEMRVFQVAPQDLLDIFEQGYRVAKQSLAMNGLAVAVHTDTSASDKPWRVETVRELTQAIAQAVNDTGIENASLGDTSVRLARRELSEDFSYVSVSMEIPREVLLRDGSVECGQAMCVFSDQSESSWSSGVFVAPFRSNNGVPDDSSMLTVGVDRVFEALSPARVTEKIVVSIGKLSWRLERLDERHGTPCESDIEGDECVGVSIPLRSGRGEALVGRKALSADHRRELLDSPLQLVKASPATVWSPHGDYSTWQPLKSGSSFFGGVDASKTSSTMLNGECVSAVDAFRHYSSMGFSNLEGDAYTATLSYLLQNGVAVDYRDPLSRRLALAASEASSSGSSDVEGLKDVVVAVPTLSASVTITGCVAMLVLMGFVVFLPTARVKLSPNTTPAAQYVQILTDDLYPDIVHKKRLRFANGDCLPFNEYIVDSIVLHAERNHKKKIYL